MQNSKFIGGILLIVGTSVGAGMLALPITLAATGFFNAVLFLVLCWAIMTSGAFLLLKVNLMLPAGSNIISMAKATLGKSGSVIAWITYLFLLYTLLSSYIAGGSDVLNSILNSVDFKAPNAISAILFTLGFALIVYQGIRAVDIVNRGFMFAKLLVYLLLILCISPHMHGYNLSGGIPSAISGSILILMASFGFASIIPSLREYFEPDHQALKRVIFYGSLIPLFLNIIWCAVIMGAINHNELLSLNHSNHATSGLTLSLDNSLHLPWITKSFGFFASICMVTAFIGVSLGLFDFLADGLKLSKNGKQGKLILSLTFLPPLLIVMYNPGIYLTALSYAGICCIILLLILPIAMAWKSRQSNYGKNKTIFEMGR